MKVLKALFVTLGLALGLAASAAVQHNCAAQSTAGLFDRTAAVPAASTTNTNNTGSAAAQ